MVDDAIRRLLCLVEGESSPFCVRIAGNTVLCDLKSLIKEERKNSVLGTTDFQDFTIWKVRMCMASTSPTNSSQVDLACSASIDESKHLTGKNVQGSVALEGRLLYDMISNHWSATTTTTPSRLRIIVELHSCKHCVLWAIDFTDCPDCLLPHFSHPPIFGLSLSPKCLCCMMNHGFITLALRLCIIRIWVHAAIPLAHFPRRAGSYPTLLPILADRCY